MTGSELKSAREALGAAQIDLARAFNVTKWTVWAWESGRHPVPDDIKLAKLRRLLGTMASARKLRSSRNRARAIKRWMRDNPDLVAMRNRDAARTLSRDDRRALGKLTWAGTTHAERSAIASARQRRRWAKVPKRERAEYMRQINYTRWAKVPASLRSKLMSGMQKLVWSRLSPAERSRINSERGKRRWARLSPRERSALMYERFWTWFPLLDRETQGRVMKAIRSRRR